MRKAAPLIILSESNLVEEPVAIDTTKHEEKPKRPTASAPGSILIKTTLIAEVLWCTQTVFLSKHNPHWPDGEIDAQTIEVPGAYTLLR